MKVLLIVFALGVAVSALPYKFDHEIKIDVYDVFKALYAAAPLSSYLDYFAKGEDFHFTESFFKFYPENEIKDFLVVFKPSNEKYLHGYYMKTGDFSKYNDEFFSAVHPIYEYINSGEYYAFTPLAAKQIVPGYFGLPLKKIFYKYFGDVDLKHDIPLVFLVPKSEVDAATLEHYLHVADYKITKEGYHDIIEYFENIGKPVVRRDVAYITPTTYHGLPFTYPFDTYYPYYNNFNYLKTGYGYPYYGYGYVNSYGYGYPDSVQLPYYK